MKPIEFIGTSLDSLRSFPKGVRQQLGFQLDRVQRGLEPFDRKSMPSVGAGVCEIRVRDRAGAYRTLYVARFTDAIYVLHCFQKKARATPKHDIEVARTRYRELVKEQK